MIFTQTAPEATAPAAVVTAESEEAFFGTFHPVSASVMGVEMPLEQIFGDALPVFTIEAGKVITVMSEGDEAQTEEQPSVFEDGVLKLYAAEDSEEPVATIQLAEDGNILLVLEQGEATLVITTEKVEAAVVG